MKYEEILRQLLTYLLKRKGNKQTTLKQVASDTGMAINTIRNFLSGKKKTSTNNINAIDTYLANHVFDFSDIDTELEIAIKAQDLSYLLKGGDVSNIRLITDKFDVIEQHYYGDYYLCRPGQSGKTIVVMALSLKAQENDPKIGKFVIDFNTNENIPRHRPSTGQFYIREGLVYLLSPAKELPLSSLLVFRKSSYHDGKNINLAGIGLVHCSEDLPILSRLYAVGTNQLDENNLGICDSKSGLKFFNIHMMSFLLATKIDTEKVRHEIEGIATYQEMITPNMQPLNINEHIEEISRTLTKHPTSF